MIDYHCHLLPGIDDGPMDVDESIVMARALSEFGYREVCCTPHCIKGYYEPDAERVREAVLMLQADLDQAGIRIELRTGIEYCLDECFAEYAKKLIPLGGSNLVLCEAPQQANTAVVMDGLHRIAEQGFVPLVAHPERSDLFYELLMNAQKGDAAEEDVKRGTRDAGREKPRSFFKKLFGQQTPESRAHGASDLVASAHTGLPALCLFQANLGSFTAYYGPEVQRRAYNLLQKGVYTNLATDLHDSRGIRQVLTQGRDKLTSNPILRDLAAWSPKNGGVCAVEPVQLGFDL